MTSTNDSEGPRFTADDLELLARGFDNALNGEDTPKEHRLGFAVLVFQFHAPGISQYVSNARREDMILALRETADRLEKRQDKPRTR